jgi:hypothetical protein
MWTPWRNRAADKADAIDAITAIESDPIAVLLLHGQAGLNGFMAEAEMIGTDVIGAGEANTAAPALPRTITAARSIA